MDNSGKKRTLFEAAESLHIELDEAISILERYANLSNLDEKSEISNWEYRVLEGIVQTRAKEKENLKSGLNGLSKTSSHIPPQNNAMCYCPAPPDEPSPKVLIIKLIISMVIWLLIGALIGVIVYFCR